MNTSINLRLQVQACVLFLAVWAGFGWAEDAHAATLTGVSVAPSSAQPNQTVTITATKSGSVNCGYRVETGDGNQVLGPFGFPGATKNTLHSYPNAGTYTVRVVGAIHGSKPKCKGSATAPVTIATSGGGGGIFKPELNRELLEAKPIQNLCAVVNCGAIVLPKVTKHFGFPKPGGVLAVIGSNFGVATGTVSLRYTNWTGQSMSQQLDFLEWTPTMVGVRIPASVTGFAEQTAQLVVTTKAGAKSAPYGFTFLPFRERVIVPSNRVQVNECSKDSNGWKCNGQGGTGDWFVSGQSGASIWGWHQNNWGAVGDDHGYDKYTIDLKNGWVFSSVQVNKHGSSSNEWVNGPSPGMPSGGTNWKPTFEWKVSPADIVDYHAWIEIDGPAGVPY